MKEFKIKYSKYDSGNVFLLALLGPFMVMTIFMFLAPIFGIDNSFFEGKNLAFSIFSSILIQATFIGIFFIYNHYKKVKITYANNFDFKLGVVNYLILIAITIIAFVGMNYFLSVFDKFFKWIGYKQPTDLPLPLSNGWYYLLSIVLLALLPAIGEELVFRGIIFKGLKNYSDKIAIFGSALLFALIHMSPIQTVYPFLFGLLLAFVVYKTNSLISSMFIHFLNNFLVVTFAFIEEMSGVALLPPIGGKLSILWCILIGLATIVIIFFLCKLLKKCKIKSKIDINNTQEEIKIIEESKNNQRNTTLLIGIVVGVALWCLTLIINFLEIQ